MLTFLPVFLVFFSRYAFWFVPIVGWALIAMNYRRFHRLNGRWIFWPRVPHLDHQADIATHGLWGRFAAALGRHPRRSWIVTGLLLLGCVAAVSGLRTDGLTITDSFTSKPDAITGQQAFDRSFPQIDSRRIEIKLKQTGQISFGDRLWIELRDAIRKHRRSSERYRLQRGTPGSGGRDHVVLARARRHRR